MEDERRRGRRLASVALDGAPRAPLYGRGWRGGWTRVSVDPDPGPRPKRLGMSQLSAQTTRNVSPRGSAERGGSATKLSVPAGADLTSS